MKRSRLTRFTGGNKYWPESRDLFHPLNLVNCGSSPYLVTVAFICYWK